MKMTVALLFAVAGALSGAAEPRFFPVDIHLDSAAAVAAWQFELADRRGAMTVVGVEGGDSDVFRLAPYYDRDAVARGAAKRIVVADYSVADENRLPAGRIRLATLHLMADGEVDLDVALVTATGADGKPIGASIRIEQPSNASNASNATRKP